jgi:hypothetical protein
MLPWLRHSVGPSFILWDHQRLLVVLHLLDSFCITIVTHHGSMGAGIAQMLATVGLTLPATQFCCIVCVTIFPCFFIQVLPNRIERLVLIEGIGLKTDIKRSSSAVAMLRRSESFNRRARCNRLYASLGTFTQASSDAFAHASSGTAPSTKRFL